MPIDNPIIINYNITNSYTNAGGDNGITLAANYYQIPVAVMVVVSEFYFDSSLHSNIIIYGQAQVLSTGQEFSMHLIKDNNINNILASSDTITATNPTSFTITKNNAESGNYQFIAYAANIGDVGDAKINYAILNKT